MTAAPASTRGGALGALLGWVVSLALFVAFIELGLRLLSFDFARPSARKARSTRSTKRSSRLTV